MKKLLSFYLVLLSLSFPVLAQRTPGVEDLRIETIDLESILRRIEELKLEIVSGDTQTEIQSLDARIPDLKVAYELYSKDFLRGVEYFLEAAPKLVHDYNNSLKSLHDRKSAEILALENLRNELSDLEEKKILNKSIEKHLAEFKTQRERLKEKFVDDYRAVHLFMSQTTGENPQDLNLPRDQKAKKLGVAILATTAGIVQSIGLTLIPCPLPGFFWMILQDLDKPHKISPFHSGYEGDGYATKALNDYKYSNDKFLKFRLETNAPEYFKGCQTSICVRMMAKFMKVDVDRLDAIQDAIKEESPVKVDPWVQGKHRWKKLINWAAEAYAKKLPTAIFESPKK